jgi:integrase
MNGTKSLRVPLKYIHQFRDRHGQLRRYFRRRGRAKIPLPGAPGTPEFVEAYNAALAAMVVRGVGGDRSAPGTVSAAIAAYYTHNSFTGFARGTQKMRRAILERFRREHGEKRLAAMQRPHVAKIIGEKKPFAARNWLKTLRGLMQFAVEIGLRKDDPTAGIEPAKAREGRIHTWTEEEIAAFEGCHPIGSRARLAMALLLYTGQRRGDVVRIGPQHVRGNILYLRQQKTGTDLSIPVHPILAGIIAASEISGLAFLLTGAGSPFSSAGFGNLFREWCDEAGLPQCSAHGLRKATCRRLAEIGCSAPEIQAISGHKSLREVQRYIEEVNRTGLARSAMAKMIEHAPNNKVEKL